MNKIYCISCEEMVELDQTEQPSHSWTIYTGDYPEYEECLFPLGLAYCPPPENFPPSDFMEWVEWALDSEPSPEEISEMDNHAIELREDFEEEFYG